MASTIKIKNSTTTGSAPSSLAQGEFAINVADGNLFYGDGSSVKQDFVFDSLRIKGDLTAEQFVVSSSVTHFTQSFSSGSTVFGDTLDDTHQFTGSILITGSITADEYIGLPSGIVSSSAQVDHDATTNFSADEHFTQANITTVGTVTSGDVSAILPAGTVSGSAQIDLGSASGTIDISDQTNLAGGTNLTLSGDTMNLDADISLTSVTTSGDISSSGALIGNTLTAADLDYPTADGEDGYVIKTDGAGNLSFDRPTIYAKVKNISGGTLVKGTPVHATGSSGNASEVVAASASIALTMPATFVLAEELADDTEGNAIVTGFIQGVDTSQFGEGDVIYVGENGGYTNVKPTGSNQIQNLGIVTKVHGSNGSGFIYGSGRSNDVPNLGAGKIFYGQNNQTEQVLLTDALPAGTVSSSAQITINESQISDLDHYTDSDVKSKLNTENVISGSASDVRTFLNVEDGADVTDATNVQAAGALMDSEVTNLAQIKSFDSSDYATAAQGALADTAIQPADTGSFLTTVAFADVTGKPTLISSSAQVDHDATTNFSADEHFTQANITTVGTVTSGDVSAILPAGTVSGSSQISFDNITDVPSGLISSSTGFVKTVNSLTPDQDGDVVITTNEIDEDSNLYYTDTRVKTKLNAEAVVSGSATQVRTFLNVEDGADVTDTTNVTAAGALMDSEVTSLSLIKELTAAQISGAFNATSASLAADIPTNNNQLTNGAGYTTNTGTVTSVGGTGTVSGLSLSGTVTTSGNLTLGGTISLVAGDIPTITSAKISDVDAFSQSGTYASLRAQGTTAGDVGLGNVTNESKATMFTSPTFTGTTAAPTPSTSDDSTKIATTAYVQANLDDLIGNAGAALDTLGELSASLADATGSIESLVTEIDGKLAKSSNLSDLTNAATARTNLGVDAAGTDNSTDVTLVGSYDYITISGQQITRNQIDASTDISNLTTTNVSEGTNEYYTDAKVKTKLNAESVVSGSATNVRTFLNVEDGADVTDATNVQAAGALMDSEVTSLSLIKGLTATQISGAFDSVSASLASDIPTNNNQLTNGAGYITDYTVTSGDVTAHVGDIDHDSLLNFSADEHFTQANITTVGTVTSGDISAILPAGTVSGSAQIADVTLTTAAQTNITSLGTLTALEVDGPSNSHIEVGEYAVGIDFNSLFGEVTGSGLIISGAMADNNHHNFLKIGNIELVDLNTSISTNEFLIHNVATLKITSGSDGGDVAHNTNEIFVHNGTEFFLCKGGEQTSAATIRSTGTTTTIEDADILLNASNGVSFSAPNVTSGVTHFQGFTADPDLTPQQGKSIAKGNMFTVIGDGGALTASIVSASSEIIGDLTGNADTATDATNATNINVGNSDDSSTYYILGALGTGNQALKRDSGIQFNSSTDTLNVDNLDSAGKIFIGDNELRSSNNNLLVYDGGLQAEGSITASGDITGSDVYINDWGSVSASLASAGGGGSANMVNSKTSPTTVGGFNDGARLLTDHTSAAITAGNLVNLTGVGASNVGAQSATAAATGMLLMATDAGDSDELLIEGVVKVSSTTTTALMATNAKVGTPLYMSTTAGAVQTAAPSTSGDIVRVVGYVMNASDRVIYFNPSVDWIEL